MKKINYSADGLIKVGDIFYRQWGYDQTNTDFFQVIKATRKMVEVRKLNIKKTYTGNMIGTCLPIINDFEAIESENSMNAKLQNHLLKVHLDNWHTTKNIPIPYLELPINLGLPILSCQNKADAYLWNGEEMIFSEYA